jgi:hypothetical protein
MLKSRSIGAGALMAALFAAGMAQAFDESKYPDLKGQWRRTSDNVGTGSGQFPGAPWDPSKPAGRGQEAPLTAEYQAVFEANVEEQARGGQGTDPTYRCISPGMPRVMIAYSPMEIVVTPEATHILIEHIHDNRRIHTDGRDFPATMDTDPQYAGYSIGRWVDEAGTGRYDTLLVETRGMKGPRAFEASGIPLHRDNQTIIKERIFLDKADPNLLHDEIATIDHALTRPWVVTKNYRRVVAKEPIWWREDVCAAGNEHVSIGKENYFLSADGLLMPTKKDQPPPDLRYFRPTGN